MIAHGRTIDEIADELDADSLAYLSMEGVYEAIGGSPEDHCDACFSGHYPLGDPEEANGKFALEDIAVIPAADGWRLLGGGSGRRAGSGAAADGRPDGTRSASRRSARGEAGRRSRRTGRRRTTVSPSARVRHESRPSDRRWRRSVPDCSGLCGPSP